MTDDDKRLAALAAVAEVQPGMLIGLGTGSTAAHAIAAIGALVARGLEIDAVATSLASAKLAEKHGISLLDFEDVAAVDLAIDGADEIDAQCRAIKGAGGAMLREKIEEALDLLTIRERDVLKMRFGLDDGYPHTLEEVGKHFRVTRERIRQIEAKALKKLRHPSRNSRLRDYLDH